MLPIYDSDNIQILRNEDIVGLEVRVAQNWPVKSCFAWDQVWSYPQILLQAVHLLFWLGLLIVHALTICSLKREAGTPKRFQPCQLLVSDR
jgi:hypothetical protein